MSNVYSLPLPTLTVNKIFINEFISADPPCFALGMIEERKRKCGFLALRPGETIPPEVSARGFNFGHVLLGNTNFEVIQFLFHFYGFKTYSVLVNPNNPIVRKVLTTMVKSGDYFFFKLNLNGGVTVFKSEIGAENLAGLTTNLPRIKKSTTTEKQYRQAVSLYERQLEPREALLHWVCRDTIECMDLTKDRLYMTPCS